MDKQKDESHLLFQSVQSIIHSLWEHEKVVAAIQIVVVKYQAQELFLSFEIRHSLFLVRYSFLPIAHCQLPPHSMFPSTSSPASHSTASVLLPSLVSAIFLHS